MSYTKDLNHFKNYGEKILEEHQKYKNFISQDHSAQEIKIPDDLSTCLDNIEKAAEKIVDQASSSVKIGVMGEFSSGKTTLLGSLLGYAGALPESEKASTGNVTYLSIEQETGLKPTQFQFKVEYLNENEVEDCLDFMLKIVLENNFIKNLPEKPFPSFKKSPSKNTEVWQQVVDWCKNVDDKIDNPILRNQIEEIQVFVQSYIRYGKNVCQLSKPIDVDMETVVFGLQLHEQTMDKKIDFDHIPTDKERLKKFLQDSFFLIRKINVEVKVSTEIWDLSSIQGANKLVLLDFPGLGNDKSGVRDKFLCEREIKNVQTILILTNGERPGDARSLEIVDLLQQQRHDQNLEDFILVGVGRFDQMNLGEEISNESLTQPISLSQLGVLHKAISSVRRNYTKKKDERIILLSAYIALDTMQGSKDVEVGSNKILTKINNPKFRQESEQLRQTWKQLSQALKKSEPTIAALLEDVAQDGGINKLRILLENHVNNHGLKQLYEDVNSEVEDLHKEQTKLKKILHGSSLKDELLAYQRTPLHDVRKILQELIDSYKLLKTYLETYPLDLGVSIDQETGGISLTEVIENEVSFKIFSWSEWRYLIDQLNNGKINIPESKDQTEAELEFVNLMKEGLPDESQDSVLSKFPTTSDDFYNTFKRTVNDLEEYTRTKIDKTIEDFLNELSNNKVSLLGDNNTINLQSLRKDFINYVHSSQRDDLPKWLKLAIDPIEWKQVLHDKLKKELQVINPQNFYPLACEEKDKNKPGQKFIWHPDRSNTNASQENHQIIMLQTRNAMIARVSQQQVEFVREANQLVKEVLINTILKNIILTLEKRNNPENLKKIVYGNSQEESSTLDWLDSLDKLASIPSPLAT